MFVRWTVFPTDVERFCPKLKCFRIRKKKVSLCLLSMIQFVCLFFCLLCIFIHFSSTIETWFATRQRTDSNSKIHLHNFSFWCKYETEPKRIETYKVKFGKLISFTRIFVCSKENDILDTRRWTKNSDLPEMMMTMRACMRS